MIWSGNGHCVCLYYMLCFVRAVAARLSYYLFGTIGPQVPRVGSSHLSFKTNLVQGLVHEEASEA